MAGNLKIRWWQWLPFFKWRVVGTVDAADEAPQRLPRNAAVLVGTPDHLKWIIFECPCRSGHRIMLNADGSRQPFWQIRLNKKNRISISPSVNYSDGKRRCHYFVRDGKIQWAHDTVKL